MYPRLGAQREEVDFSERSVYISVKWLAVLCGGTRGRLLSEFNRPAAVVLGTRVPHQADLHDTGPSSPGRSVSILCSATLKPERHTGHDSSVRPYRLAEIRPRPLTVQSEVSDVRNKKKNTSLMRYTLLSDVKLLNS